DFTVFPIIAPTFTVFELTPNVTLPDGEYVFVSPGSLLIDVNSIPVDSPAFAGDFFLLRGDANGDAQVDLADFGVLRANFGSSNATFAQGDFNFDGSVDLADFGLLRANFGTEAGGFRGVPVDFAALTPPPILFDDESRSLFA
ncbi:MAG: dockerin type I domain-containing protein, partial [Planctomycetota bacterium]